MRKDKHLARRDKKINAPYSHRALITQWLQVFCDLERHRRFDRKCGDSDDE